MSARIWVMSSARSLSVRLVVSLRLSIRLSRAVCSCFSVFGEYRTWDAAGS